MTRREGDDRGKQATGDHRVAVQNRSTVEQCCGVIPVIYEDVRTTLYDEIDQLNRTFILNINKITTDVYDEPKQQRFFTFCPFY